MDEELIEVVNRKRADREAQEVSSGNSVAALLGKALYVARKMYPMIFEGAVILAVVCFLAAWEWISAELILILTIGTIIREFFRAGMVWQSIRK